MVTIEEIEELGQEYNCSREISTSNFPQIVKNYHRERAKELETKLTEIYSDASVCQDVRLKALHYSNVTFLKRVLFEAVIGVNHFQGRQEN